MMIITADAKCKRCGITYESAHLTYDGWKLPVITNKCVKKREKCKEYCDCMTCFLDGGHIVELYGTGRHKWI